MNKTAIIFAAGIGSRLKPLTLTQHKSLVLLKNKPLIEVIITYLLTLKTLRKIIIITGYQHEKFNYLTKLYPKVTLVNNPYYLTAKSAIVLTLIAPELINNNDLYFISGDFVMKNNCFFDELNLNVMAAVMKMKPKNDWSYQLNDSGTIIALTKNNTSANLLASEWTHITSSWAKILHQDLAQSGSDNSLKTMHIGEYLIASSIKHGIALTPYLIDHQQFWDLDDYNDLQRINTEFK